MYENNSVLKTHFKMFQFCYKLIYTHCLHYALNKNNEEKSFGVNQYFGVLIHAR